MRVALSLLAVGALSAFAQAQVTIKATNHLPIARANQTIELSAKDLPAPGPRQDLSFIHITDSSGKEVLAQAVDTDFDSRHLPDIVIFQADFAPNESKTFTAALGAKQVYTEDQFKAHGRFVRERFDDFAWENDRIAHRMYGKALETWEGEPLTSSSVDIWSKRTPKMVIDKWYMVDNYHTDTGEGYDDYSAGATRGDGATGLWFNNELSVTKNFIASRVLADGPIRVMFELDYDPITVNGLQISETKRITLDGGSNLDHYQNTYKPAGGAAMGGVEVAIGLKKVGREQVEPLAEYGALTKWEPMEKNGGMQGLAVIVDKKAFDKQAEGRTDHLMIVKPDANNSVSYWAGFCWDKGGQFTDFAGWKKYVEEFSQSAASPIEVSVGK